MPNFVGPLRLDVVRSLTRRPCKDSIALQDRANELAAQGEIVSAMMLDDIALLLERGHDWNELLDDVVVRAPLLD